MSDQEAPEEVEIPERPYWFHMLERRVHSTGVYSNEPGMRYIVRTGKAYDALAEQVAEWIVEGIAKPGQPGGGGANEGVAAAAAGGGRAHLG